MGNISSRMRHVDHHRERCQDDDHDNP